MEFIFATDDQFFANRALVSVWERQIRVHLATPIRVQDAASQTLCLLCSSPFCVPSSSLFCFRTEPLVRCDLERLYVCKGRSRYSYRLRRSWVARCESKGALSCNRRARQGSRCQVPCLARSVQGKEDEQQGIRDEAKQLHRGESLSGVAFHNIADKPSTRHR